MKEHMIFFDHHRLHQLMKQEGLENVTQFASACGWQSPKVAPWFAGNVKPGADSIAHMCNTFGCDPNYFFAKKFARIQTNTNKDKQ